MVEYVLKDIQSVLHIFYLILLTNQYETKNDLSAYFGSFLQSIFDTFSRSIDHGYINLHFSLMYIFCSKVHVV